MKSQKKKFSLKRLVLQVFLFLFGAYAVICLVLFFMQDSLIFHPQPFTRNSYDSITLSHRSAEALSLEMSDGILVSGWFVKDASADEKKLPLLIYYPGNAEEVSHMIGKKDQFPGWNLALMNYRGYGISEGRPSEEKLFSDALEIFDALQARKDVDTGNIIACGRSIGTGVATFVSLKRNTSGTILVTPYDCLSSLAQEQYPFVPVSLLLKHHFNSLERAPLIGTPCLCLVAAEDRMIPPAHAGKLAAAWKGKVRKRIFKGAGHNNIMSQPGYREEIIAFLKSCGK